ncbi:MAG: GTP cyclohydrolase FolE2 [Desulfobulbaceae bacterium]|nr:GTP cyclohydrolase FolE2 [Desulfobulbaceae bacterium]
MFNKKNLELQNVGIKDVTYPVSIKEKTGSRQQTIATISLEALMPHQFRDSCVSVFTHILGKYKHDLHMTMFPKILAEVRERLQADRARMKLIFPYFISKFAPVSNTESLMEYKCSFVGDSHDSKDTMLLEVQVPVTTLCPCSKEISEFGAHNQRAEVTLTVEPLKFIWLEDLITMVEQCGSCQLFALLKRPDEKYVTEQAYTNPMFVEDVVRKVSQEAFAHPDIGWFSVGVESFESIHKHSAYAYVDSNDLE